MRSSISLENLVIRVRLLQDYTSPLFNESKLNLALILFSLIEKELNSWKFVSISLLENRETKKKRLEYNGLEESCFRMYTV